MAPAPDLILYDGVCGLCNGFVRFMLPRDVEGRFRFAALQSDVARAVLERHGRSADDLDTVVLVQNEGTADERVLERSTAVLAAVRRLHGAWRWLGAFLLVPRPVRDLVYRAVAAVRYRVFGKSESCLVPLPRFAERFIDGTRGGPFKASA